MWLTDLSTASWSRVLTIRVLTILVAAGLSLGAATAQAAEGTTARAAPPKDWDEAVGLWIRRGPGHTRPVADLPQVHNGTIAANRLLDAAQRRTLATVPCLRVLQALREMQWQTPGPKFGCFRWYWEETEPVDTNAAFFIGGPLIEKAGDTAGQAKLATIMHQAARRLRIDPTAENALVEEQGFRQ